MANTSRKMELTRIASSSEEENLDFLH